MTDLRRLQPLPSNTDCRRIGEPTWYISVWYFGGRDSGTIATFPNDQAEAAEAEYRRILAEGDGEIKEVILGHQQTTVYPDGRQGRNSCISLISHRTGRNRAWREGLYW
jgi:ketosteroid isomerase-like protein